MTSNSEQKYLADDFCLAYEMISKIYVHESDSELFPKMVCN